MPALLGNHKEVRQSHGICKARMKNSSTESFFFAHFPCRKEWLPTSTIFSTVFICSSDITNHTIKLFLPSKFHEVLPAMRKSYGRI